MYVRVWKISLSASTESEGAKDDIIALEEQLFKSYNKGEKVSAYFHESIIMTAKVFF